MRRFLAYGCLLALITAFPQVSHAAWQHKVLVTTPILQPIIEELMEGLGTAESLTSGGQSPHQTSFTPSQAKALNDADVIISPDAHVAPAFEKILAQRAEKGALVIYLTDLKSVEALPYRATNPFLSSHAHRHKKDEDAHATDPHFWLDPLRVANMLPELAAKIATYWPEDAEGLKHNATSMALRLRAEVHPGITDILAAAEARHSDSSKTIPFITYHDAYQYFQKRYGLEAGYMTQRPEEYQGAKTMQQLLKKANDLHIRCILSETENHHVMRIAELSQASVVTLNPERPYTHTEVPYAPWAKNGYDRMLLAVAKAYASCL
jgi:zinc transport system substrate-binding protein